ncbi:CLUMA_CG021309, isoform A [Clunio marinus]|uniref:CLUMA_CG021309, isoform A n=1 Tax=Clunio marinus TaxID=568069 RepID=A0A1J1J8W2_9DIPT|nr:CLUMA_CG021309, isoform A [Clunio marinus]
MYCLQCLLPVSTSITKTIRDKQFLHTQTVSNTLSHIILFGTKAMHTLFTRFHYCSFPTMPERNRKLSILAKLYGDIMLKGF